MRRVPASEAGRRRRFLLIGAFVGLLAPAAALCTLIVFPHPLFPHRRPSASIDLRSDEPLGPSTDQALRAAHHRILAMPLHLPHERYELFLCHSERIYRLFAFLTRTPPFTQGLIVSSATGTVVLSAPGIRRMRERTGGEPAHSRLEGTLDAAIAHEVAHLQVRRRLGLRRSVALPPWKSEGWADYSAHRGNLRSDPGGGLAARVAALLDNDAWRGPMSSVDRRHYGWQLLVEYLVDVEDMSFDGLIAEGLTEAACRSRLLAWYARSRRHLAGFEARTSGISRTSTSPGPRNDATQRPSGEKATTCGEAAAIVSPKKGEALLPRPARCARCRRNR